MRAPSAAVAYGTSAAAHPRQRQPVERGTGLRPPELVEQPLDALLDLIGELELGNGSPSTAPGTDRRPDLDARRPGDRRARGRRREHGGARRHGGTDERVVDPPDAPG